MSSNMPPVEVATSLGTRLMKAADAAVALSISSMPVGAAFSVPPMVLAPEPFLPCDTSTSTGLGVRAVVLSTPAASRSFNEKVVRGTVSSLMLKALSAANLVVQLLLLAGVWLATR